MSEVAAATRDIITFGPFRLIASERRLMRDGAPVELGGRALDLLLALVSRPKEVIGKRQLIAQVWPDVIVEEGSLRFHIAALRKALGDDKGAARYIATVPGRGYCFVAPLSVLSSQADANPTVQAALPHTHVPPRATRIVGRADEIREISTQLTACRFVSIVGPGGVGKTTVAVAVAHELLHAFAGAVLFIDLGENSDPGVAATSLASTLDLAVQSPDPLPAVIAHIRNNRMLLILDNCEHVIEAAAILTETIFRHAPQVHILATSREPLRVEGEHVYRLRPLLVPPDDSNLTPAAALTYPAVQLFVERAAANGALSILSDADVAVVTNICRRLDGVALAIELAARRVPGYGLQQTAALLEERLSLMWLGQRTAPPRQKTLQATLDWSYGLLSGAERIVLRRLAIFVGYFDLDAARAIARNATIDEPLVLVAIDSLVAKSMVVGTSVGSRMRYRLLEVTRAYAREKLAESGEADAVALRHATYYRDLLQNMDIRSAPEERRAKRAALIELLGNVRAGLAWSLADRGNVELGIQLAAISAGLFIELSLLSEYRDWTKGALSALEPGMRGSWWEMELLGGLGHCLMFTKGNGEQVQTALERASEIAEALEDRFSKLRLLTRLHMYYRRAGQFNRLIPIARRVQAIATDVADPLGLTAANGLLGTSHHLVGNQLEARKYLEAASRGHAETQRVNASHFGFHFDPKIPLARVMWLLGYPDAATEAASELTKEPTRYQDPVTFCIALIWGISVFRWIDDWETVEKHTHRLVAHAERCSLEPFQTVGLAIQGEVFALGGNSKRGIDLLRGALARLHADRYGLYTAEISCAYALCLARAGSLDDAMGTITDTIASVESRGGSFMMPEALRLKGEFLAEAADPSGAADCFRASIALSEQQSALSWRLRALTSFAKLANGRRDRHTARVELAKTYAQFNEGHDTADLNAAKGVLDRRGQAVDT